MAHPRSRGGTSPTSRCHTLNHQRVLSGSSRKSSPGGTPRLLVSEKVRPARPLQRLTREKTRPTRLKTAFFGRFGLAGRTFSRTGHSHVATMQPMTPLQPLTRASVKPPSPMLAPKQRPLKPPSPMQPLMQANVKPPSPMQPKNASKTPISHPQRRWRFQPHTRTSKQRRRRFHARDL